MLSQTTTEHRHAYMGIHFYVFLYVMFARCKINLVNYRFLK